MEHQIIFDDEHYTHGTFVPREKRRESSGRRRVYPFRQAHTCEFWLTQYEVAQLFGGGN